MINHCSPEKACRARQNRLRRTESDHPMFRLLKYAPIVIPMVVKFVKSPRGQRMIQSAKSRVSNRSGGPTSRGR